MQEQLATISAEEREETRKKLLLELDGVADRKWVRPFLAAYEQTGIIGLAADAARITRRSVDLLRQKNRSFDMLVHLAKEKATDILEGVARSRAIHGTRQVVLHHGKPVKDPNDPTGQKFLYETKTSDALMIFLLKKQRYPDQVNHTHAGPGGGPIPVQHTVKMDEMIRKVQGQLQSAPPPLDLPEGPVIEAETDDTKIITGETDDELIDSVQGEEE